MSSCGAVWLLGMLATYALLRPDSGEWQNLQDAWGRGCVPLWSEYVGPTMGLLLVAWTLCALGASLAQARSWFVAVGGFGSLALMAALLWTAAPHWPLLQLLMMVVFAVTCQLTTVILFIVAQ